MLAAVPSFRLVAVGLATLALGQPASVQAEARQGQIPRSELPSIHKLIAARPLSQLGDNAIRFTSSPALGGRSIIVEIAPFDKEWARGRVYYLYNTRRSVKQLGHLDIGLARVDFESVLSDIERFAREKLTSDVGQSTSAGEIVICTDGPGYLTEYRHNGQSHWISGFCGDHANNYIARLIARVIEENTGKFTERLGGDAHPFNPSGQ